MPRKRMYSTEFKFAVVKRYLEGNEGVRFLSKELHVDKSDIQKWRDAYLAHGVAGLENRHGTYTGDFKLAVIEYMHKHSLSLRQAAAHFNIPSYSSISKWERMYYEEGKEALFEERRGRCSKMGTKRPRKPKDTKQEHEDLVAEVQRLRMENEYLKKLNALVQEREKSRKKTK